MRRWALAAESVGGETKADLLFQKAVRDRTEPKNWVAICASCGIGNPRAAEDYFTAITSKPISQPKAWTPDELHRLSTYLDDHPGECDLSSLQALLPFRSAEGIRKKVRETRSVPEFTAEDDRQLMEYVRRFPGRWDDIAQFMRKWSTDALKKRTAWITSRATP
jgi:hypothetical protein